MQRFVGRQIGESRQFTRGGVEAVRVYVSRKGKYVVHRQKSEWSDYSVLSGWIKEWKNWRNLLDIDAPSWGEYTLEVVDTFGELRERIPAKMHRSLNKLIPADERLRAHPVMA